MTKTQLIDEIADMLGISKKAAADFVNAFVQKVMEWVKKDWETRIQWFWTFKISNIAARNGVNPRTRAKIKIPAMKLPKFKAWTEFKKMVA